MTDPEAEVLNRIKSLGGPVRAENLSDSEADALRTLVIRGYVERGVVYQDHNVFRPVYVYTVTDAGRLALAEHQELVDRYRNDAARKCVNDKPAQRKIVAVLKWVAGIVAAIIATIVAAWLMRWINF